MVNSIEEFLQVNIYHTFVSVVHILHRFGYRFVATAMGTESMTALMELGLIQRFKNLPYGFLDHAINHVGDSKPSLATV